MHRLLFVTRGYPYPGHTGGLQYSSLLLDAFSHACDRVDVVCAVNPEWGSPEGHPDAAPANARFFTYPMRPRTLHSVLGREPLGCQRWSGPAAERALEEALRQGPDLVVIDHFGASWALARLPQNLPLIYCTHNDELPTRLSIARHSRNPADAAAHVLEAWRIYRRDKVMARWARLMTAISKADEHSQNRRYGPSGMSYWPPCVLNPAEPVGPITSDTPRRICLIGGLGWSAKKVNLLRFLDRNAMPLHHAGIGIAIAGRAEPWFLDKLSRRYPFLLLHGELPDLDPVLRDSRIAVLCGEAGGGFRMTALTYVFSGRPILARPALLEDLELRAGRDFLACNDERDFHLAVRAGIDDVEHLNALAARAREASASFATPDRLRERAAAAVEKLAARDVAQKVGEESAVA